MTESAYSIFKRPAIISGRPFRKSEKSMTGVYVAHKHYSANIPQEINLAAFPWQLIADKGSFDGGSNARGDGQASTAMYAKGSSILPLVSPRATFRAALTERQINVDRVSIRKAESLIRGWHLRVNGQTNRQRPAFTHADLYSRCFNNLLFCYVT